MRSRKRNARRSGETVHLVTNLDGSPLEDLYDDCPLCRELKESGAQVFSLDLEDLVDPVNREN